MRKLFFRVSLREFYKGTRIYEYKHMPRIVVQEDIFLLNISGFLLILRHEEAKAKSWIFYKFSLLHLVVD